MSLKTSIVGVQVKHIKGALQYLSKIGEHASRCTCIPESQLRMHVRRLNMTLSWLLAGSEVLVEALPEKVSGPSMHAPSTTLQACRG